MMDEKRNESLQEKIIKIQNELKAPKSRFNAFGKYAYRSAEDILEAVKPLLLKYNVLQIINDNIVLIGDRYYIESTIKLLSGKEEITTKAYAREENERKGMNADQLTGASSSYARKYALNAMYAIDDNKDSDDNNDHKDKKESKIETKQESKQEEKPIDAKQKDILKKYYEVYETTAPKIVMEYMKKQQIKKVATHQQALDVIRELSELDGGAIVIGETK